MHAEVQKIEVTEVLDATQIPVIRITNPFNPREYVTESFTWKSGKSLAAYFPMGSVAHVVSINGKIVMPEDMDLTYLERGDNLVMCPIPQGGGDDGDKSILGMIAIIAIAVIAPYIAGPAVLGFTAGSVGFYAAVAGITIAGSMLVHSIFAPSKKTDTSGTSTSTYGIDGPKNTSTEGMPVPVCYGKFRMAGNIVGLHVENEGDNQILFVLINAGEGPVADITDVRLNDNPITDYKNAEMQVRLGRPEQSVIPWFADTVVPQSKNLKLTTDWITHTTVAAVDKLRVDVAAPSGLFSIDKKGGATHEVTVGLEIQYRKVGDSQFKAMSLQNVVVGTRDVRVEYDSAGGFYDADGQFWRTIPPSTVERYTPTNRWVYADTGTQVTDVDQQYIDSNYDIGTANATVPLYGAVAQITAGLRAAVRRSFDSGRIASGHYEVRIRRTSPKSTEDNVSDELYVTDINEIILSPMEYPNTALLGIKVTLGDQLSGMPQITFLNHGRQISVWGKPFQEAPAEQWYDVASSNPAWILWDMLTNRRFGGGMQSNRLDFYAFKRWAAYCDAQGLKWNGPIDSEMNVWDASQYVLRVGHAQIINIGTRYSVVVERAQTPMMMFSVANMVENSYKESWLGMTDRANEVDVTFFDKEDNYKQRTIKIYDPAALTAGAKQRSSAVTLYGVTEYDRAFKEGMFMMNLNRYILKTINFSAPLEAVACSVGDLIYVQNDMPNWAQAGRFEAGGTRSVLNLDRPVTMEAGKTYKLLALFDKKQRASGAITNIAGNTVFLGNFDTSQPVKRLVVGALDMPVLETYQNSVVVDSTAGLSVGASYLLYDTDVIEEQAVVLNVGDHTSITLQSPLTALPSQFGQWMFGEVTKVKAPFRIKSIASSGEYNRDISALQYDERVYEFDRFAAQTNPITNPTSVALSQVRSLELYEESRVTGSQITSVAIGSWQASATGQYGGADVYVKRITDGPFQKLGEVSHRTNLEITAEKGETITIKVVAFDLFGQRAPYEPAPTATCKIIGEVTNIDVGSVTGTDVIWSGRDCRITWRYNSTTHSYEFGSEPVGVDANAGSLDPQFQDYEVRVFHADDALDAKPRRVEHTTDNSYTYTFDKNYTDGLERRLRFEILMRDKFNNLGNPSTIVAYNPPPTVTGFSVDATFESANLKYTHSADADFAGAMIWLARYPEDVAGDIHRQDYDTRMVYDGPDTSVILSHLAFNADYYVRIAAYDAFGKTELIPSTVQHFKTSFFDVNAIAADVLSDSVLIPALRERINLIDAPFTTANSVAARILTEAQNRTAAVTAEAVARDAAVAQEAAARVAALAAEALTRSEAITAEASTRAAALIAEANARGAAITSEANTRQTADSSLASLITTVTASSDSNAAAIQTEATARTNADTALATSITTLTASVNTGQAATTALINTEQTTRASADTALASSITALSASTANNIAAAVTTEQTARVAADGAIAASVTALTAQMGTDIAAAVLTETNARTTADGSLASQITSLTATVSGVSAAVTSESSARSSADGALASQITALTTTVSGVSSSVTTESNARSAADGALASTISALDTRMGTDIAAAVLTESTARSTADTAISNTVSALTATVSGVSASVTTESTARASADGALATSISNLTSQMGTDIAAAVQTETNARTTAVSAVASDVTSLYAITGTHTAAISSETTARTNADGSLSQQITDLAAATGSNITAAVLTETNARTTADTAIANSVSALTSRVGNTEAGIANEASVRASAVGAVASDVSTLYSTTAGHTTAIQTNTTSINGLSGQFTVKIDNNGYVAGFGLASYPTTSGITSEFIVRADKFAVIMPSYAGVYPFTIGAVNSVPRVIISSALIGDATIGTAMIGDAQVETLKIKGDAVTVPRAASGEYSATVTLTIDVYTTFHIVGTWTQGTGRDGQPVAIYVNTYNLTQDQPAANTLGAMSYSIGLGAGTHSFQIAAANNVGQMKCSILVLGAKR